MPFIHPKGMISGINYSPFFVSFFSKNDYIEIKTPAMMSKELWEISGHWENYRHNMFTSEIEKHEFAIKPMNCPGCMLFYKGHPHSYRELPLRVAEIGNVHRYRTFRGTFRPISRPTVSIKMMPTSS